MAFWRMHSCTAPSQPITSPRENIPGAAHFTINMQSWPTQLLREILKTLCATTQSPVHQTPSQHVTPTQIANEQLSTALPVSLLSALEAISPRATRAAISEMEDAVKSLSRADLVTDTGQPLEWPQILSPMANVFIEPVTGQVLIRVARAKRDHKNSAGHLVLLRDLRFRSATSSMFVQDASSDDLVDTHCDCKAFAFRPAIELLCKHVIVAMIVAGANLAPRTFISEDRFIEMLPVDGIDINS